MSNIRHDSEFPVANNTVCIFDFILIFTMLIMKEKGTEKEEKSKKNLTICSLYLFFFLPHHVMSLFLSSLRFNSIFFLAVGYPK